MGLNIVNREAILQLKGAAKNANIPSLQEFEDSLGWVEERSDQCFDHPLFGATALRARFERMTLLDAQFGTISKLDRNPYSWELMSMDLAGLSMGEKQCYQPGVVVASVNPLCIEDSNVGYSSCFEIGFDVTRSMLTTGLGVYFND